MWSHQSAPLLSMALGMSVCCVSCLIAKITKNVLTDYQWGSGVCGLNAGDVLIGVHASRVDYACSLCALAGGCL